MASISLAERHASICQFPAFAFHRQDSGASPRQTDSPTKRLDPSPRKRSVSAPRKNGLLSSPAEVVRRVRDECRVMLYFPSMKKAPTITDWDQICERTYRLVDYIPLQPFLNWKSRGKVVHWIVHVGSVEECTVIEIHLAVSIFDRFLAIRMVKNITFVALSCLVLAVKSSRPKNADQAVERIAFCAGYPVRESSAMTTVISNALDETDVSDIIHIQSFLESICKICHCDDIMRDLVNYLAECMLTDYIGMISFYPSEVTQMLGCCCLLVCLSLPSLTAVSSLLYRFIDLSNGHSIWFVSSPFPHSFLPPTARSNGTTRCPAVTPP